MASHAIWAISTCAFHALLASTLEIKQRGNAVVVHDSIPKDYCSACAKDMDVSWDVKCTYAKSCALCTFCKTTVADLHCPNQLEVQAGVDSLKNWDHAITSAMTLKGLDPEKVSPTAMKYGFGNGQTILGSPKELHDELKSRFPNGTVPNDMFPLHVAMTFCQAGAQSVDGPEEADQVEANEDNDIPFDMFNEGNSQTTPGVEADCEFRCRRLSRCARYEWHPKTMVCKMFEKAPTTSDDNHKDAPTIRQAVDAVPISRVPLADIASASATPQVPSDGQTSTKALKQQWLGKGIAEGCPRGHDCGYEGGVSKEAVEVPCKSGKRWMSPNALVLRGGNGTSAIYCSVPKVGTSYMFGVMHDLGLEIKSGNRNAAYENVGEIVKKNDAREVERLCQAYSFILIRNPWERVVSAYVDKVLTREVFKEPPSFFHFMMSLAHVEHPNKINQHFRPASEICHTSGAKAHHYDEVIEIEKGPRSHLEKIFVRELDLPPHSVHKVLQDFETNKHPTTVGDRWRHIDLSLSSALSRVDYYFRQSDPELAAKVYKYDIEFGNYTFMQFG